MRALDAVARAPNPEAAGGIERRALAAAAAAADETSRHTAGRLTVRSAKVRPAGWTRRYAAHGGSLSVAVRFRARPTGLGVSPGSCDDRTCEVSSPIGTWKLHQLPSSQFRGHLSRRRARMHT
jgi:hypothetical protein